MTAPPIPDVESLARAVEEAWGNKRPHSWKEFRDALTTWLTARRSARDAGLVPVLVSRESLEALRVARKQTHSQLREESRLTAHYFLDRDLAPYLKEQS